MSEKYNSDRALFASADAQREFLLIVRAKLGNHWKNIAKIAYRHPRTIREWSRGNFRMPFSVICKLAKKAHIRVPPGIKVLTWKEHLSAAGKAGGYAVVRMRGGRVAPDENHRLSQWRAWWEREGKHQPHPIINKPWPILIPSRSDRLAEFAGIIIGDGGISSMQVIVTLHRNNDKKYIAFVCGLIKELFGVTPAVHQRRDSLADNIVVSRVALVRYCVNTLGLKQGNKIRQQVAIPAWINKNKQYLRACLRGLMDTDGSIFNHRYRVGGKEYTDKKLCFVSASRPLMKDAFRAFRLFGMHPRLAAARDIRLDSQADVQRYFKVIGTNNPKHLKRYMQ